MEGNQIGENFTAIPNEPSVPNNNEPESPPPPYDQVTQQRPNRQKDLYSVTQQPDISDKLEYAPASKTKRKVMKVHHEAGVEIIGGTGAVYGTGAGAAPTIIMNRIQSMIAVAYAMILSLYVT
ncbi:unnamed protein product [Rotaria magnacalcarata]|uniref:Uncharacterized protein n=1 Tax=Rotaria magnacalcarata TaxID=392030 RepID=A0A817ASH1_9BILA|nr:unnamed protein product [Rotaria magnacalcarata]